MMLEISRALADRTIKYILVLAIVGPSLWGAVLFLTAEPVPGIIAKEMDNRLASFNTDYGARITQCMEGEGIGAEDKSTRAQCDRLHFSSLSYQDERLLIATMRDGVVASTLPIFLGAWIIGALAAARDWLSNSLDAIFPAVKSRAGFYLRRTAAVAAIGAGAALTLSLLIFGWAFLSRLRGSTAFGIDSTWMAGTSLEVLRLLATGALGATAGFGLASVTRSAIAPIIAAAGSMAIYAMAIGGFSKYLPMSVALGFVKTAAPGQFLPHTWLSATVLVLWCAAFLAGGLRSFLVRH